TRVTICAAAARDRATWGTHVERRAVAWPGAAQRGLGAAHRCAVLRGAVPASRRTRSLRGRTDARLRWGGLGGRGDPGDPGGRGGLAAPGERVDRGDRAGAGRPGHRG